ncbi:hypothetical protein MTZ49_02170 [Entomomonas sp. E2T0]|uniref:hypothetical protein n=1 Tax=Entomomonas sp. E2T0 TaxID=2930213 RepID=UPI0022284B28|nr:hypothetical protein [Entomomonas sp. E2T0]UYZ84401.1 hypothetical protein MTZ49_02170 [Entomomonas sp. E2T0]
MTRIYLIKWLFIIISSLIFPLISYGEQTDETDLDECIKIAKLFDKNAFSTLFDGEPVTVNLRTTRNYMPLSGYGTGGKMVSGCSIDFILENKSDDRELGGVRLAKQQNAYEVFKRDKANNSLSSKAAYPSPNTVVYSWASDTYYEYMGINKFQEFGVYTKKGDYIIFRYNNNAVLKNSLQRNNKELLEKNFIEFINIVIQQMKY